MHVRNWEGRRGLGGTRNSTYTAILLGRLRLPWSDLTEKHDIILYTSQATTLDDNMDLHKSARSLQICRKYVNTEE